MWQFSSPEIAFGEDAVSRLAEIGGERAFIVTDANMVDLGFVKLVQEQLELNNVEIRRFVDVEPDPSIQTVHKAKEAMTDFAPDLVIALGGGSCLDAAKVAWFLYEQPEVSLEEINPFVTFDTGTSRLVAIPTTSGTGADTTIGVVLTDTERERKLVFYARELQPHLTIVDPSFVMRLPPQITADTGMDVVSHAVEAFASPWHNDFADGLCIKAMELALKYLPRAYAKGSDAEAREHMHNAATIAGLAITNSSVALAHALAHSFGAVFRRPHGRIVGIVLPYTIEYTANSDGSRYAEMARFLHLPAATEAEGAASLVAAIRELARMIDQPTNFEEMGIDQDDFDAAMQELVVKAAEDHQMLTTLRMPDEEDLERLFRYAYEGRSVDF